MCVARGCRGAAAVFGVPAAALVVGQMPLGAVVVWGDSKGGGEGAVAVNLTCLYAFVMHHPPCNTPSTV
jgi:hypothetical protein